MAGTALSSGSTCWKSLPSPAATADRSPFSSPSRTARLSPLTRCGALSMAAYIAAVEWLSSGLTITSQQGGMSGRAASFSPRPVASAVPPRMKNGTSLPNRAAISSNCPSIICGAYNVRRARSTAAASLLPPPSPAWVGIVFSSRMVTKSFFGPNSSKNTRSAFMHRLSPARSVTGGSHSSLSHGPAFRYSVTVSCSPTPVITVSTSWYPSGRFSPTDSVRFTFAQAFSSTWRGSGSSSSGAPQPGQKLSRKSETLLRSLPQQGQRSKSKAVTTYTVSPPTMDTARNALLSSSSAVSPDRMSISAMETISMIRAVLKLISGFFIQRPPDKKAPCGAFFLKSVVT